MNESWKRLIEVERRLAALDASIYRTNQSLLRSSAAIRNDAINVPDPFGTGGGGGGGGSGVHRFPTSLKARVTWNTTPTLVTANSQNTPADGPELAAAAADMVTGFVYDKLSFWQTPVPEFWRSPAASAMFQRVRYGSTGVNSGRTWNAWWFLNKLDGGDFLIDYEVSSASGSPDLDEYNLTKTTTTDRFNILVQWPLRTAGGAIRFYDDLRVYRTYASTDVFSTGPKYGEHGTWSFAMTCAATAYHTAGDGTIYLDW